ncbi:MAG: EF-P lysine aminoacylase GenX [Bdellovibrionaceae bacterium]|nr:EF-P lysine aminoacylase GenX [Pseudobdellovibrionaceae bacterium]
MTANNTYPEAPKGCYSLSRLKFKGPELNKFWVGGEVFLSNGDLVGLKNMEFQKIWPLPEGNQGFQALLLGDHVALNIHDGEVVEYKLLTRARCEKQEDQSSLPEAPHRPIINNLYNAQVSQKWSQFLALLRSFFKERGMLEVETPSLVVCPGSEPTLDYFETKFFLQSKSQPFFLPTSPELHLKKMISAGWSDIYEIKKCYRNNEIGVHHQPEFWMLEFYRSYANLELIELEFQELFDYLYAQKFLLSPLGSITKITMADLFKTHVNFNLSPQTSKEQLYQLATRLKLTVHRENDSWDDLFFYIFVDFIEPKIEKISGPVLIYNYPPSQAALARLTREGWADRFEIYINGLEIANAFHELNDPHEQEARLNKDQKERLRLGKAPFVMDHDFLQALKNGLPPCSGVAVGLERLFMALHGIPKIQSLKPFPLNAPE